MMKRIEAVARTWERKFLGFTVHVDRACLIKVAPKMATYQTVGCGTARPVP
ncbi:MAG: hypothetical protein ACOYOU_04970 [Kiritimatiellia bacterium]